jgi:hypothetical protein
MSTPPNWLKPRIVGRFVREDLRIGDPVQDPVACGSAASPSASAPQGFSLMKAMPTFSLVPTKLKPSGWKMSIDVFADRTVQEPVADLRSMTGWCAGALRPTAGSRGRS